MDYVPSELLLIDLKSLSGFDSNQVSDLPLISHETINNFWKTWQNSIEDTINFYRNLLAFVNENHQCLWCRNAEIAIEITKLLVYPDFGGDTTLEWRTITSNCLNSCASCIISYWKYRKIYLAKLSNHLKADLVTVVERFIDLWNVSRLENFLLDIQHSFDSHLKITPQPSLQYLVFEILSFPCLLLHPRLENVFADAMITISKQSKLSFKFQKILPGLVVCIFSEFDQLRLWSLKIFHKIVTRIDHSQEIWQESSKVEFKLILDDIVSTVRTEIERLEFLSQANLDRKHYRIVTEKRCLLNLFSLIILHVPQNWWILQGVEQDDVAASLNPCLWSDCAILQSFESSDDLVFVEGLRILTVALSRDPMFLSNYFNSDQISKILHQVLKLSRLQKESTPSNVSTNSIDSMDPYHLYVKWFQLFCGQLKHLCNYDFDDFRHIYSFLNSVNFTAHQELIIRMKKSFYGLILGVFQKKDQTDIMLIFLFENTSYLISDLQLNTSSSSEEIKHISLHVINQVTKLIAALLDYEISSMVKNLTSLVLENTNSPQKPIKNRKFWEALSTVPVSKIPALVNFCLIFSYSNLAFFPSKIEISPENSYAYYEIEENCCILKEILQKIISYLPVLFPEEAVKKMFMDPALMDGYFSLLISGENSISQGVQNILNLLFEYKELGLNKIVIEFPDACLDSIFRLIRRLSKWNKVQKCMINQISSHLPFFSQALSAILKCIDKISTHKRLTLVYFYWHFTTVTFQELAGSFTRNNLSQLNLLKQILSDLHILSCIEPDKIILQEQTLSPQEFTKLNDGDQHIANSCYAIIAKTIKADFELRNLSLTCIELLFKIYASCFISPNDRLISLVKLLLTTTSLTEAEQKIFAQIAINYENSIKLPSLGWSTIASEILRPKKNIIVIHDDSNDQFLAIPPAKKSKSDLSNYDITSLQQVFRNVSSNDTNKPKMVLVDIKPSKPSNNHVLASANSLLPSLNTFGQLAAVPSRSTPTLLDKSTSKVLHSPDSESEMRNVLSEFETFPSSKRKLPFVPIVQTQEPVLLDNSVGTVYSNRTAKLIDNSSLSNPTKIAIPSNNPSGSKQADFHRFQKSILSLNLTELDLEHERFEQIPNVFKDIHHYRSIFEPLLLSEAKAQILKSKNELSPNAPSTKMIVQSVARVNDFYEIVFSCEKTVNREVLFLDHDLLSIKCVETPSQTKSLKSFIGLIVNVSSKGANIMSKVRVFFGKDLSNVRLELREGTLWHSLRICNLVTNMREFAVLNMIESFHLLDFILKLNWKPMIPPTKERLNNLITKYNINHSQATAVYASLHDPNPVTLIQGPPGTGKTTTIMSMLAGLFSQKTNKILLCAPSNAAVDELVRRLKQGLTGNAGTKWHPSIIRFGTADMINDDNREFFLETLVNENLSKPDENQKSSKDELDSIKQSLDNLESIQPTAEIASKISQLKKKLFQCKNKIRNEVQTGEDTRMALKLKILRNAQIIVTTLSSSGHDLIVKASVSFDMVIVDEACQCVEISCMIPFRYNCKRCILVGDPNQLPPTILSQSAASYFEQSFFQRIQNVHKQAPFLLSMQYRMHPDICKFPSETFYAGKLETGPNVLSLTTKPWHSNTYLKPFQFFDVVGTEEKQSKSKGSSLSNYKEAEFAVLLVSYLCKWYPDYSFGGKIGVITPYKEQVRELKKQFKKRFGVSVLNSVEIASVDAFQGQEKEIIIFSCVRGSNKVGFLSDTRRLNVAMTRAKSSLWILGKSSTLNNHPLWKEMISHAVERGCFLTDLSKSVICEQKNSTLRFKNIFTE